MFGEDFELRVGDVGDVDAAAVVFHFDGDGAEDHCSGPGDEGRPWREIVRLGLG